MKEKKSVVCLVRTQKGTFVMLTNDGSAVHGFPTVAEGVAFFERAYERKHRSGHQGSMSACLAFIQIQPAIVETTLSEIKTWLGKEPTRFEIHGEVQWMLGCKVLPEFESMWEKGTRPQLIHDGMIV